MFCELRVRSARNGRLTMDGRGAGGGGDRLRPPKPELRGECPSMIDILAVLDGGALTTTSWIPLVFVPSTSALASTTDDLCSPADSVVRKEVAVVDMAADGRELKELNEAELVVWFPSSSSAIS